MPDPSPSKASQGSGETAPSSDRSTFAFVLLLWLAMLSSALLYVRAFAPPFPTGDDATLFDVLPPQGGISWSRLWRLHNEHLIPLPRLAFALPYFLTSDLRAAEYLQVLVLGAVALGMILLARRLRGKSHWTDTVYPLLWLHVGNGMNLLSGFQIALTVPTAIACAILAGIAVSPGRASVRRAIGMGCGLVSLPLCGGVGLAQAPALAVWCAGSGWAGHRSPDRRERAGGRILLAAAVVCAILCALYFRELAGGKLHREGSPGPLLDHATTLLALGLGPGAREWAFAVGGMLLLLIAATTLGLATGMREKPVEIGRRLGLLASSSGAACLVVSIIVGRAAKDWDQVFVLRYVALTAPLLCLAHVAWTLYGSRRSSTLACGFLAIAAWAALPLNIRIGMRIGQEMRDGVERFERRIENGAGALELVQSFTDEFPNHLPEVSRKILRALALLGRAPFDRAPALPAEAFDYLTFSRFPSRVESDKPTYWRVADGGEALVVHAGTVIHLDVHAGETKLSGRFGIPAQMIEEWRSGPMRILVERVRPQETPRILLDRTIDPTTVESDRGTHPFALEGSLEPPCEILLRTESAHETPSARSWSYWSDIRIE